MVKFRINWTLYTGEVTNLAYQGRGECLFICLVYHSFKVFCAFKRTSRERDLALTAKSRESEFPPTAESD